VRVPRPLTDLIDEVLRRAASDLSEDEAIHDLRVACRRLEAGARVNRTLLPRKHRRAIVNAAKTIRRAFDQARDLEVIAAEIADLPDLTPAFKEQVRLAAAVPPATSEARSMMENSLRRLTRERDRLEEIAPLDRATYAALVAGETVVFFQELDRLLPESTDEALHETRISAKKLRYAMEIGRSVFPRLAAQVKRIKRLQDILGRHQDAAVGLRWAESLSGDEYNATPADRAVLMRYYTRLRREQRRHLRRLLAGWRARDIKNRFLAALQQRRASGERHAEERVDDAQRGSDAREHYAEDSALLVR
jgi:CHAD domain-containing protein